MPLRFLARASEVVRQDRPGSDGVDADVPVSVVEGRGLRQADHAVLGGHVPRQAAHSLQTGRRRHVDDGTALPGLQHGGDLVLHGDEHASKGDGDRRVVRVDGHVGERGRRRTSPSRVVERQIEFPERLDRPLHQLPNGLGIPHIGGDGDRAPPGGADRGCERRQLVFAPRREGDRSARIDERAGRRRADAPTGAGDDRDLAMQGWILQTVGHLPHLLGWSLPARSGFNHRRARSRTTGTGRASERRPR